MYTTSDLKIKNIGFQQQSKCFGLIYTMNPTNTNCKSQWSIFSTNYKFNIIKIKLNMPKFFVKLYENQVWKQ